MHHEMSLKEIIVRNYREYRTLGRTALIKSIVNLSGEDDWLNIY